MKRLIRPGLTACFLAAAGCQSDGPGSEPKADPDTVERQFWKPVHDVWEASLESARSLEFLVTSHKHELSGGELVARDARGREVHARVRSLDEKHTQVRVRGTPPDRELAMLFHERIAQRLGLGEATPALPGGNTAQGVYATELGPALLAARRALGSLGASIVGDVTHTDWANVDGRLPDSTPLRIRLEQTTDGKTTISFIAGNEHSDSNTVIAQRLKKEFEAAAQIQGD